MSGGTESDFELATIERLKQLGYSYAHGKYVERNGYHDVILEDRLRDHLQRRYIDLQTLASENPRPLGGG